MMKATDFARNGCATRAFLFLFAGMAMMTPVATAFHPNLHPTNQQHSFFPLSAVTVNGESTVVVVPEPPATNNNNKKRTGETATTTTTTTTTGGGVAAAPSSLLKKIQVQRYSKSWYWTPDENRGVTYRINYRVEGEGRPILLTHGFGANLNHFRYNIPALVDAGYKVYAMDLIGFGGSEKPLATAGTKFSMDLFAQQIQEFMDSRKETQPWILAGNSMGSLASLLVAARGAGGGGGGRSSNNPSKIQKSKKTELAALVLFNSAGGMTGFRYSAVPIWAHPLMAHVQYFLMGPWHGTFFYNLVAQRQTVQTILTQGGIYQDTTRVDDELLDLLLDPTTIDGAAAKDVFLKVFTGPAGPTREELIPKIKVPMLALWGENDTFTPYDDDVKALPNLNPQFFRLDTIANAGHCLHDEHPVQVNQKMIDFLRQHAL